MHRRDGVPEQGFAAAFGEETSPGQGQGPGQQSMKILWMQNSFSRLLPRALGLLVRIQRAGERPAVALLTSPSVPFGSVRQVLDPNVGKQHGSFCPAWHRAFP